MRYSKIILVLCLILVIGLTACARDNRQLIEVTPEIDSAVSKAILDHNRGAYYEGECPAEGHLILEVEKKNNYIIAYIQAGYSEYGFENGNFVGISGSVVPAVITLDENYNVKKYEEPLDGSEYIKSIKRLFPKSCMQQVLDYDCSSDLTKQLEVYAKRYLDSINRSATIGTMSEFDYELPPDFSEEVTSKIEDIITSSKYPYWIGNAEVIENGKRYVYQTDYSSQKQQMIFTKYEYDNPDNIIETKIVNTVAE